MPTRRIDPYGLIYEDVDTYVGGEFNGIAGGGVTFVTCQEECGNKRTMVFVKFCIGAAIGGSAGAGFIDGLNGPNCRPDVYDEWFFETGIAVGPFGGSVDIGLPDGGVIEGGPTVGAGFQIASFCYYVYVGDL